MTERYDTLVLGGGMSGLPLALRIVAALLADRPHLLPAALAGRLRDEQSRVDGLGFLPSAEVRCKLRCTTRTLLFLHVRECNRKAIKQIRQPGSEFLRHIR